MKYHGTSFSLEGHMCSSLLRGRIPVGPHVGPQNAKSSTCLLPAGLSCITSGLDNKNIQYQSKVKKNLVDDQHSQRCQHPLMEQEPCLEYRVLKEVIGKKSVLQTQEV